MTELLLEAIELKKYFPIKKGVFSKTVGNVKAVDGISFKLYKGETLGLVGESGCGKSTVGRTILNLIPPSGGRVEFESKCVFDVDKELYINKKDMCELRKDMQIIFQDPFACLDPRMTIDKIMTEGIIKHGICKGREASEKAASLLEICGMDSSCLSKYPHQFSGGQRQRVGIARALSLNPKLIVCDEPTAALDVSIQSQVLNLMLQLKKDMNLSYLFISHDLGVVRNFCNRICVMYLGTIVETAESNALFEGPRHPYSKALLDAMPTFDEEKRKNRKILAGDIPSPSNPPLGCRFHTRCPEAAALCSEKIPEMKEIEPGHHVACHFVK